MTVNNTPTIPVDPRAAAAMKYPEMAADIMSADLGEFNYPSGCHPIFRKSEAARALMMSLVGGPVSSAHFEFFSLSTNKSERYCIYESEMATYHSPNELRRAAADHGIPIEKDDARWKDVSGLLLPMRDRIEEAIIADLHAAHLGKVFYVADRWQHPRGDVYRKIKYVEGNDENTPVHIYRREYRVVIPHPTAQKLGWDAVKFHRVS